jgi:hypothetical protein
MTDVLVEFIQKYVRENQTGGWPAQRNQKLK